MPRFYGDESVEWLDVEPSEFIYNCGDSDINELIEELRCNGYLNDEDLLEETNNPNLFDIEWKETLNKMRGINRHQLSNEDVEIIKQIANKI